MDLTTKRLLKRITAEGNPTINRNCKPELITFSNTVIPITEFNEPITEYEPIQNRIELINIKERV